MDVVQAGKSDRWKEAAVYIRSPRHVLLVVLGLVLCLPVGFVGLFYLLSARRCLARDLRHSRLLLNYCKTWSWFSVSLGCALWLVALIVLIFIANSGAVFYTFFDYQLLLENAPYILGGFIINIELFLVCEILILGWALIVAVVREMPGPAAAPTRIVAAIYTDVFRGVPSLLVLLIIGLGLRRTGLPLLSDLSDAQAACLALTLNYGAYVAEVFRAGLHSVHWSQTAAARSLGLSYAKTMRLVVLPQAVRHVIPPLLNSFISLQKDTSLVTILGVLDAVNRAQAVSSYSASLSPYTGVALCFLVITLPLTRLTEYLAARDRRARLSRS